MRIRFSLALTGWIVIQAGQVFGQEPTAPQFEVASIKPSADAPGSSSGIGAINGRMTARHVTLRRCIQGAYGMEEARILDGPKWIDQDRYYIEAKASGPAGDS